MNSRFSFIRLEFRVLRYMEVTLINCGSSDQTYGPKREESWCFHISFLVRFYIIGL